MKFLRLCLLALAFLALPLASITFADITAVEEELPDLLGQTARDAAASPETQAEFAENLGTLWIEENPDIVDLLDEAGLDPETVMAQAFGELSQTEAFGAELDRAASAYGVSLLEGTTPQISLDFSAAIRETGINFDPAVVESLDAFASVETTPVSTEDVSRFSEWVAQTKQMSGFVAVGAIIVLLLLTRSIRAHLGSLFFIGMPVLLLQRLVLQEVANDPDPVDALVGQAVLNTWLPWTHLMMSVSAGSLLVLLVSYKLFPKSDFNTVAYAKNSKFVPERPAPMQDSRGTGEIAVYSHTYSWENNGDHQDLRELSIVED